MPEYYMSQIVEFGFDFAPKSFKLCDGQLLSIASNDALFSLLGTRFGGDGHQTFALPDLRGKSPNPNAKYYICVSGIYPAQN